jgi:uncharacterized RDD family membrane protein YckC
MIYAGVALRFVAVLIDGVLFLVLTVLIALFTGGLYSTTENGTHEFGVRAGGWWPIVLFFAYYVTCETMFGRTVGKRLVGLRVVNEDGDRIGWGQSLVRNLLRIVDALFLYLVAAISVWSSPTRQRLGDRAARTLVVRDLGDRPAPAWAAYGYAPPAADGGQVVSYTEEEFIADLSRAKQRHASRSD